jgi:hypothetical protein
VRYLQIDWIRASVAGHRILVAALRHGHPALAEKALLRAYLGRVHEKLPEACDRP